ncbi:MAG TPA: hypothetical protein VKH40_08340, partial [Alloacidobacterium sp.]|nr:hypothetical protein [Alloacidobacterium sp.]
WWSSASAAADGIGDFLCGRERLSGCSLFVWLGLWFPTLSQKARKDGAPLFRAAAKKKQIPRYAQDDNFH